MSRSRKDRSWKRERWLKGIGRCMESTRFTKRLARRRTRSLSVDEMREIHAYAHLADEPRFREPLVEP